MKKITLAITLVTFANIVAAGGLTDPKVIPPPMVGNGTDCEDENKGAESGYSGAFNSLPYRFRSKRRKSC